MSVKDRMQALGGHARSSRQPPLRERRVAGPDKSVAADDIIDRNVPANLIARGVEEKVATGPAIAQTAPSIADEGVVPLTAAREDDATSTAKRAIIHEWENWSALHSDELDDPDVAEYFFRHLQAKKPHIVNFADYNCDAVRKWLRDYRYT